MLKIKDNVDLKELEKFGFYPLDEETKNELEEDNNCWDYEDILYYSFLKYWRRYWRQEFSSG